jgi:hypothetical protein
MYFRNGRLGHVDPEFQEFAMNARGAPPWVRLRHRANERTDVRGHRRSPDAAPTVPSPPQLEASPMPRDDGLWLDDHECRSPSSPDAREPHPEPAVCHRQSHPPRSAALQDLQLVPQRQDVELKRGARTRRCAQRQEKDRSTDIIAQKRIHRRPQHQPLQPAPATSSAVSRAP